MIQTIIVFYNLLGESTLLQKIVFYLGIICLITFCTQITKSQFEKYFGVNFIISFIYSTISFMVLYFVLRELSIIEDYTNFLSDFIFKD